MKLTEKLKNYKWKKRDIAVASAAALFLLCIGLALSQQTGHKRAAEDQNEEITEQHAAERIVESTGAEMEEEEEADDFTKLRYHKPGSSLKSIAAEEREEEFRPDPERLNLAFFYPEDADTSDAINSYGGHLYQELHVMNADYYSNLHNLCDTTPLALARKSGIDTGRIMGKYNPQDDKHDPGNPDTWTINSFKNIKVQYYNGDGKRINGYYFVQELMSLANVYAYYHNDYSYESIKRYCIELFNSAVTYYKISVGTVYYDDGCLNKTKSQESAEAIAQEARRIKEENELAIETAKSSGTRINGMEVFTDLTDLTTLNSAEEELTVEGSTVEEIFEESSGTIEQTAVHYYEESTSEAGKPENSTAETQVTAQTEATTAQTSSGDTTAAPTQEVIEEIIDDSDNALVLGESYYAPDFYLTEETVGAVISETPYQTSGTIIAPTTTAAETSAVQESYHVIHSYDSASAAETIAAAVADVMSEEEQREQEALTARYIELLKQANVQSSAESYCPGHIDLYVKVTIRGLEDKKSLFMYDKIGNNEKNFTNTWHGWTDEMIAHAKALNAQDWLEEYGLSISSINLMNPLTDAEILKYLGMLPADVSDLRRSVIRFALSSVGNIPYYWGGKPAGPGYENNNFYKLIDADYMGRILKGLDCSGWINWVYWSVTGKSLAGQSTGTLIACGSRINRKDLRPGDIIIRTGDDAHVVMFLAWADNDEFYAIHETGNITNNVTITKMAAKWPYYRSLIP